MCRSRSILFPLSILALCKLKIKNRIPVLGTFSGHQGTHRAVIAASDDEFYDPQYRNHLELIDMVWKK